MNKIVFCDTHPFKELLYFCDKQFCRKKLCCDCLKFHKDHENLYSISDLIVQVHNKYDESLKNFNNFQKKIELHYQQLEKNLIFFKNFEMDFKKLWDSFLKQIENSLKDLALKKKNCRKVLENTENCKSSIEKRLFNKTKEKEIINELYEQEKYHELIKKLMEEEDIAEEKYENSIKIINEEIEKTFEVITSKEFLLKEIEKFFEINTHKRQSCIENINKKDFFKIKGILKKDVKSVGDIKEHNEKDEKEEEYEDNLENPIKSEQNSLENIISEEKNERKMLKGLVKKKKIKENVKFPDEKLLLNKKSIEYIEINQNNDKKENNEIIEINEKHIEIEKNENIQIEKIENIYLEKTKIKLSDNNKSKNPKIPEILSKVLKFPNKIIHSQIDYLNLDPTSLSPNVILTFDTNFQGVLFENNGKTVKNLEDENRTVLALPQLFESNSNIFIWKIKLGPSGSCKHAGIGVLYNRSSLKYLETNNNLYELYLEKTMDRAFFSCSNELNTGLAGIARKWENDEELLCILDYDNSEFRIVSFDKTINLSHKLKYSEYYFGVYPCCQDRAFSFEF